MKHLIKTLTIIAVAVLLTSCGIEEREFDKETWNNLDDIMYANRESMVKDLMENHLYKGVTYKELIELIGQPENYANLEPNTIGYEIMVDYGWDIDPVEGKTLYMELSQDSAVIEYRLEHWNH